MNARQRRRSDNRARGGATVTFLKHARTAWQEGRVEDAAWLQEKARNRWSKRRTRPEVPASEDVLRVVNGHEVGSPGWVAGMRLLTVVRVHEAGHSVGPVLEALLMELEEML